MGTKNSKHLVGEQIELAALAACGECYDFYTELGVSRRSLGLWIAFARRAASYPDSLENSYRGMNKALKVKILETLREGQYSPKYFRSKLVKVRQASDKVEKVKVPLLNYSGTPATEPLKVTKAQAEETYRNIVNKMKPKETISKHDVISILDNMFQTIKLALEKL